MSANKDSNNPSARAPETASREKSRNGVVQQRTPHAQPVREVLDSLQVQAKDAIPDSIFDDDAVISETTPLMKRMRSEVGSATVSAKRRDSNLQANVAIEVRCDRDELGDAGCYHVRVDGHVATEGNGDRSESELSVLIGVNDSNGCLELDRDHLREDITSAVRLAGVGALERKH